MKKLLLPFLALFLFVSCEQEKVEPLTEEVLSLTEEVLSAYQTQSSEIPTCDPTEDCHYPGDPGGGGSQWGDCNSGAASFTESNAVVFNLSYDRNSDGSMTIHFNPSVINSGINSRVLTKVSSSATYSESTDIISMSVIVKETIKQPYYNVRYMTYTKTFSPCVNQWDYHPIDTRETCQAGHGKATRGPVEIAFDYQLNSSVNMVVNVEAYAPSYYDPNWDVVYINQKVATYDSSLKRIIITVSGTHRTKYLLDPNDEEVWESMPFTYTLTYDVCNATFI